MDAGDQTLYFIFKLADFGMEGGMSALKLTGKGAANVATTIAQLGKSASKILLRDRRVKSLLKHGDIDTTVLTIKETDQERVQDIMKRNKITGFTVKPASKIELSRDNIAKSKREATINIFIRSTDAQKALAILGELATIAGRVETVKDVPEKEVAQELRAWESDKTESTTIEAIGDDLLETDVQSPDWGTAVERLKSDAFQNDTYLDSELMTAGYMVGEVAENPFAKASTRNPTELVKRAAPESKDPHRLTAEGPPEQNSAMRGNTKKLSEDGRAFPSPSKASAKSFNTSKTEGGKEGPINDGVMAVLNYLKGKREKASESSSPRKIIDKSKER